MKQELNRRQFLRNTLGMLITPALPIVSVGAMVDRFPAPTVTPTEWPGMYKISHKLSTENWKVMHAWWRQNNGY